MVLESESESESRLLGNTGIGIRIGITCYWNRNWNWNHGFWKTLESESESESALVESGLESESLVSESFTTLIQTHASQSVTQSAFPGKIQHPCQSRYFARNRLIGQSVHIHTYNSSDHYQHYKSNYRAGNYSDKVYSTPVWSP